MLKEIVGSKGYHFNEHGQVFDPEGKILDVDISSSGTVRVKLKIDQNFKYARRSVARLILDTVDPRENSHWLSVRHLDRDVYNVRPDNLEWSEDIYIPDHTKHRCDIPGMPGYSIDRDGVVIHTATGTEVPIGHQGPDRRPAVVLKFDGIPEKTSIHRLLALTFLEHPHDVDHLWVNHLDGNPLHNFVDNLEWCTPGQNTSHAYKTGLRDGHRQVLAKNVLTGEVKSYPTLTELGNAIGATPAAICVYLSGRVMAKFSIYKGHQFKYSDDPAPWAGPTRGWTDRGILLRNLSTNKVTKVRSPWKASTLTGINEASIRMLLQSEYIRPWHGWMAQWAPTPDCVEANWPNYAPDVTAALEKMTRKGKSCLVTCLTTGTVRFFSTIVDWVRADNISYDPATVGRGLMKKRNVWSGHRLEYVNPADLATYVTLPVDD